MIRIFFVIGCTLLLSACGSSKDKDTSTLKVFETELAALQDYFSIPGVAAIVEKDGKVILESYKGYADIDKKLPLDSMTAFPIASLTKVFSATLVFKLIEDGQLNLDDPVSSFLPSFPDSIKVKHLLSHTSQGETGKEFYYSSRFRYLTDILEKVSDRSFEQLMQEKIFSPLKMKQTFLLKDSAQLASMQIQFAQPYMLGDSIQPGEVEYGFSAAAGIVTTPREMMRFCNALDEDRLISLSSRNSMMSPFKEGLPYGYGFFTQRIEGREVVWAYGQYDAYSGLLLKIPSEKLTILLMANNNLLSDPARLIMGDISSSLFALSFLKNFVLDLPDAPLFSSDQDLPFVASHPDFFRKKKLATALAASFLAVSDSSQFRNSSVLIREVFHESPDYLSYADINLLHTLCFLKDVAFYREYGEFSEFDEYIERISEKLLSEKPADPYGHSYLGTYYDRKGQLEKAKKHFQQIVSGKNFSENWYTKEARSWLEGHRP